jgi:hypothetical protein
MADCAACSAGFLGRTTAALFPVREPRVSATTCDGWGSMPAELDRRWPVLTAVARSDPVVRGPSVAPMWPPVPAGMKHRHILRGSSWATTTIRRL